MFLSNQHGPLVITLSDPIMTQTEAQTGGRVYTVRQSRARTGTPDSEPCKRSSSPITQLGPGSPLQAEGSSEYGLSSSDPKGPLLRPMGFITPTSSSLGAWGRLLPLRVSSVLTRSSCVTEAAPAPLLRRFSFAICDPHPRLCALLPHFCAGSKPHLLNGRRAHIPMPLPQFTSRYPKTRLHSHFLSLSAALPAGLLSNWLAESFPGVRPPGGRHSGHSSRRAAVWPSSFGCEPLWCRRRHVAPPGTPGPR